MARNALICFSLVFFLFPRSLAAEDDFQYWSRASLKAVDTKTFDFITHWEFRNFNDASNFGLWYTSQKLQLQPHPNLGFGLNYTYLENEVADEFKYQHRLELEVNPQWKYEQHQLLNRNRVEFRWIEDKGSDNARYRQLFQYQYQFLGKKHPLASFYLNNELFFDFRSQTFHENRATPAGLSFRLHDHIQLKVFYMIQSRKGFEDWSSNQILGTHLSLSI